MILEGTLTDITAHGSWATAMLERVDGGTIKVVGDAVCGLQAGVAYVLRGRVVVHDRFGEQFRVEHAEVSVDKHQLASLLTREFAGCGEKTAKLIVADFDERGQLKSLSEMLANRPWEAEGLEQITGKKMQFIGTNAPPPRVRVARTVAHHCKGALPGARGMEGLLEWLEGCVKHAGSAREVKALDILRGNPYAPLGLADGYTFEDADRLAAAIGFPRLSENRLGAIAVESLKAVARKGHSFATAQQFAEAVTRIEQEAKPKACLETALKKRLPVVCDEWRIYLKPVYEAECKVADAFASMVSKGYPLWSESHEALEDRIEHLERDAGMRLDASQREAVVGILTSARRLHCLTAGPGRGKTTVMEVIATLVPDVIFCASTGIAAKVLSKRVGKYGQKSMTVQALLQWDGEAYGMNSQYPLVGNLFVVDEAGMQDLLVCAALVEALPLGSHLLLVGDSDQLESVGVGRVLSDVSEMPEVDNHTLTVAHRSAVDILDFLEGVKEGVVRDEPSGPGVRYVGAAGGEVSFDAIKNLWLESVDRVGIERVGLLFAYRRVSSRRDGLSVSEANVALQEAVNPARRGNKIPGSMFRVGDRIIVKKNFSLKRKNSQGKDVSYAYVVNGDKGALTGFTLDESGQLASLELEMDDARVIELPVHYQGRLDLAYAQTVHSAQGSEYDEVILVVTGQGNDFLNRKILYTGSSRARKVLTVVGRRSDVQSIAATEGKTRNTWLQMRIQDSKEYR